MEKNRPTVSILTLVCNHEAFIRQTIDGVLSQTFQNWEWIILDDGSTDGTGEIIRKIRDGRIQYAFQAHAGPDHLTGTYNKALAMCGGEFIALLDGDDYWPDNKIEIQLKSFDDPDTVLSYGECSVINQRGKEIYRISLPEDPDTAQNSPVGSALRKLLVDKCCFMVHPTVMVRRSVLVAIGGFIEARGICEDFPTWLRLSLEGRFAAIPQCLGYYRKYLFSVSATQAPLVYFDSEVNFLRDFVLKNDQKLKCMGLSYDMDKLERHWARLRLKVKLICVLRAFSSLLKIDLVNFIVSIKLKVRMLVKNLHMKCIV